MQILKKYIMLVLLITLAGLGVAISLKASIGIGPWDAMTKSIAVLSDIKIGTVGMILNCACILGQIVILRKDFKLTQLLQIPVSIYFGVVVNFFLYDIFDAFTWENYILRFVLFIFSVMLIALAVSAVMILNVVTFAVEGLCMAIATNIKGNFAKLRQLVDVISICVALLLTFLFSLEITLREGTIISMLIFGPLLGIFMKFLTPIFARLIKE